MINENNIKNYVGTKIKKYFLRDVVYLYEKTKTFWLVYNVTDAHKLLFWKSKTKFQRFDFRKICNTPESSWNFIMNMQKQLF